MRSAPVVTVATCLLALLAAACPGSKSDPNAAPLPPPADTPDDPDTRPAGGATPQEVFDRVSRANQAGEYAEAFNQLTIASQDEMLAGLLLASSASTLNHDGQADPMRKAELDQISLRYEVGAVEPPEDGDVRSAIVAAMASVKDRGRLFQALTRFLERGTGEPARARWVGLEELDAGEDRATGVLLTLGPDGSEVRQPIAFRRVDGRWLLHITEETTAGGR